MEIKELNNVVSQFLSLRSNGSSVIGGVLGEGFADLMEQTSATLVSKDSEVKVADVSQKEKAPAAQKNEDVKDSKKTKADKKEYSDNDKKDVAADVDDKEIPDPQSDVAAVQNEVKAKPQNNKSENKSEVSSVDAVAKTSDMPEDVALPTEKVAKTDPVLQNVVSKALETSAVAILNGDSLTLLSSDINLQALSAMGDVKVLDASSGEVISLTGKDLAVKIQQTSEAGELFALGENISEGFVELLPAEVVAASSKEKTDSSVASSILSKDVSYNDTNLAEQALALDDKIGQEQKVKIEVSVKEDKSFVSVEQGLVQDKVSLHKALEASMAQDEKTDTGNIKNKTSQIIAPSQQQTNQSVPSSSAAIQGISGVSAANGFVAAENISSSASSVKVASVGEISGNTSSQALMSGSELLSGTRGENTEKTNGTSFRDIYKGMSKEVIEQVKVNITKSAVRGVDKIDVSLKPEDLGHIEIKMQISKDGKLHAHIISSRPETMDILQREAQSLEKAFNDAGFQTDDTSLSFSFRNDGQAGTDQERNAELRSFIGNVLESEQNEELVSNDNLLYWDPAQGLNIRV